MILIFVAIASSRPWGCSIIKVDDIQFTGPERDLTETKLGHVFKSVVSTNFSVRNNFENGEPRH